MEITANASKWVCLISCFALAAAVPLLAGEIQVEKQPQNPWNHLRIPDRDREFSFAIVSDNAGLPRPGVFEKAIRGLDRLRPDFVISVGDVIGGFTFEGRIDDVEQLTRSWDEITTLIDGLGVPFFYVVGNNDINSPQSQPLWQQRFGRTYYSFEYQDVLFIALNSDDPPGTDPGGIGGEQLRWLQETLETSADVRWTFVFLHRPLWTRQPEVWAKVERLLGNRKRTVFAGHLHAFDLAALDGQNYYTLATTGGASALEGPAYGSFDHIVWVSFSDRGPVVSNILLDGIFGNDPVTEANRD